MDERIYPEFCGNHTNLGSSLGFWLPTPWPDWSVPGVPALLAAPCNRQKIHSYQQRSICVAYRSPLVMQLLSSMASSGDHITQMSLLNQATCRKSHLKADQHHHRSGSTYKFPHLDLFFWCPKIHQQRPFNLMLTINICYKHNKKLRLFFQIWLYVLLQERTMQLCLSTCFSLLVALCLAILSRRPRYMAHSFSISSTSCREKVTAMRGTGSSDEQT